MRCERAQDLFSDYCEGSVSQALRIPLEGHLEQCPSCRSQVRDLRDVWRLLDASPRIEPPVNFHAAVWQRIEASQQRRRLPLLPDWRRLFARPALAWGAAALLLIAVLVAGGLGPGKGIQARFPGLPEWLAPGAAPAPVSVRASHYEVTEGRVLLVVPLVSATPRTVRVAVGHPAARVVGPSTVQVPGSVTLEVLPGAQVSAVELSVYEAQGSAAPQSLAVGLPAR